MSVSRCLLPAAEKAARTPRTGWKEQIDELPVACPHPGICTGGVGCRERVADYLRVQFKAQARREQVKGGKRA
ncbi:hypothetical protein ACIPR8_07015 [Stenotrophomonas sp. LARHCG68]